MNWLQPYLSDALVQSLAWTFIHSLWIGALISVLFLCVEWILKNHSAQVKYMTGMFFLLAFPLTMSLVFVYTYQHIASADPAITALADTSINEATKASGITTADYFVAASKPYIELWISDVKTHYFYQYHSILVAIWLLGVLLLSAQNIGGYFYTGKLRRQGLFDPSDEMMTTFHSLLKSLRIEKTVLLMESLLVKAPVLIGHFKPVILLPLGLATSLSTAEIEAILAHELSHIRRHDFLINIIQSSIEVVFFYHPGVWLLGSTIRAERENCCDDMAIGLTGSKLSLALALTHVEEWKLNNNLALGFSGNNNSLLNRIKRIINNETMKAQHREGNLLATVIVAGLCISTLTALKSIDIPQIQEEKVQTEQGQAGLQDLAAPKPVIKEEPVGRTSQGPVQVPAVEARSPVTVEATTDTLQQVQPAFPTAAVVWESMDSNPAATFPAPVSPVGDVSVGALPVVAPYPAVRWEAAKADRAFKVRLSNIDTSVWDAEAPQLEQEFTEQMRAMAAEMATMQGNLAAEIAARAVEMGKAAQFMTQNHQEMAAEMAQSQQKMALEMAVRHKEMAEMHQQMAMEFNENHQEEMMAHQKEMIQHQKEMLEEQNKMRKLQEKEMLEVEADMRRHEKKMKAFETSLKSELVRDGLISATDEHFKLKINAKELLINGEKQPSKIYDKYRKFFNEELGEDFSFERDGNEETNMTFSF